jgi:hypothetical protein
MAPRPRSGHTRTRGTVTGSTPHLGNAAAPGFTQTNAPPVAQPQPVDPNFENAKQTAARNIAVAAVRARTSKGT